MGNWNCSPQDASLLAAAARDFCPFPDYSPSPLFNILSANSSLQLSEHYAAVQASLTPPQQQDFTQTLRSTFGREGKVSNGGLGVVALSLAVLFDTVARQVKGEYEPYGEPIPGLFLRDPRGTYPPPVHTISQYLRLVPHIANNPTRMRDETEKYLLELNRGVTLAVNAASEDISGVNLLRCIMMGKRMVQHTVNKTIAMKDFEPSDNPDGPNVLLNLNCDPKEASERFLVKRDSFDDRTKEAFKRCDPTGGDKTAIESFAWLHWVINIMPMMEPEDDDTPAQTGDFDLKAKALGKWV